MPTSCVHPHTQVGHLDIHILHAMVPSPLLCPFPMACLVVCCLQGLAADVCTCLGPSTLNGCNGHARGCLGALLLLPACPEQWGFVVFFLWSFSFYVFLHFGKPPTQQKQWSIAARNTKQIPPPLCIFPPSTALGFRHPVLPPGLCP